MGWYVYNSEINGGKPITCKQCRKPVTDGDPVYFVGMQPLEVEHTACLEDRVEQEAQS